MQNLKCKIIPVITGATIIVTRFKEKFGSHTRKSFHRVTTKTTILGSSHIIQKVLQSEPWNLGSGYNCWFNRRRTSKDRSATKDDISINNNIIIIIIIIIIYMYIYIHLWRTWNVWLHHRLNVATISPVCIGLNVHEIYLHFTSFFYLLPLTDSQMFSKHLPCSRIFKTFFVKCEVYFNCWSWSLTLLPTWYIFLILCTN